MKQLSPEELARRKKINRVLIPVVLALLLLLGILMNSGPDDDNTAANDNKTDAVQVTEPANKWEAWQRYHVSGWDGSCKPVVAALKKALNDPGSYDHAETQYYLNADTSIITVLTSFRAKNAFGGLILTSYKATLDINGDLLTLEEYRP